jgi:glycine/D-amino acid oxidase-like deaminating enzyme
MQVSIWEKESFFAPCDVVIAGSGFTGLWSAYYLKRKEPDLRITIIDKGFIPTGASTRNAGFACFGSATELLKDMQTMGEYNMLSLVEMRYEGLGRIRKVFSKKEIDYENYGGYELINSYEGDRYKHLLDRVKYLNKGLRPIFKTKNVFELRDEKIKEFGFSGIQHIIYTEGEGQLHSGKLCQLLLQKVQAMGVNILPAAEITYFTESDNGVSVYTDKNISIHANKMLVCTNGFAKKLLPELDITPARGQVLVTAPVQGLKIRGSFHYDEGFYYFRNLGNRLLLGGARNFAVDEETTTEMEITENIQYRLEQFISNHLLPGTHFEITDRWSGIMGIGSEKMPIVKQVSSNTYCAVRMSGMGVALAPVAGNDVAKLILGR